MTVNLDRRRFLQAAAATGAAFALPTARRAHANPAREPLFKISLAQWSLHRALFAKQVDPLEFAAIAKKEHGIEAIEYVNQFYKNKVKDPSYVAELKKRADDLGVRSLLIMCDGEGNLGDRDGDNRMKAVENHHKWVEMAKVLGCHSIRVNAASKGSYEEQMELAADGLRRLTEYAAQYDLNVIVENHGGLSSNGAWLAGVMKKVAHPRCGTLPDFGNFKEYDRYKGVQEMMPYARGVSAKSHDFDGEGNETHTDYFRMLKIVVDAGYHGHLGIEYEGKKLSEPDGIRATKTLLERVHAELSKAR